LQISQQAIVTSLTYSLKKIHFTHESVKLVDKFVDALVDAPKKKGLAEVG